MTSRITFATGLTALTVSLGLISCAPAGAPTPEQTSICTTNDWTPKTNQGFCTEGQKIAYLPEQYGDVQLPLFFIAANCDMRYAVSTNAGGAVCIFKTIDPEQTKTAAPIEPEAPAPEAEPEE